MIADSPFKTWLCSLPEKYDNFFFLLFIEGDPELGMIRVIESQTGLGQKRP